SGLRTRYGSDVRPRKAKDSAGSVLRTLVAFRRGGILISSTSNPARVSKLARRGWSGPRMPEWRKDLARPDRTRPPPLTHASNAGPHENRSHSRHEVCISTP